MPCNGDNIADHVTGDDGTGNSVPEALLCTEVEVAVGGSAVRGGGGGFSRAWRRAMMAFSMEATVSWGRTGKTAGAEPTNYWVVEAPAETLREG